MNKAFLLIGGNQGKKEANLRTAKKLIARHAGDILLASSIYETAPWGKTDQPDFLNQALEIETSLGAEDLMSTLLEIEKMMGRSRDEKFGPRIIDIDIIFYFPLPVSFSSTFLTIPHPQMQNRRFVLVPLAEIAPNEVHPLLKKTVSQLLAECSDTLEVKKL